MSLNPKFVTASSLQEIFVDKTTGLPLSGGKLFFYSDVNRANAKTVYTLQGNEANYTYTALPNPITLSAGGTVVDNNGFPVVIYYYPFNEFDPDEQELYYVEAFDSLGENQLQQAAWPNPDAGQNQSSTNTLNLVPNGQFLAHTNLPQNALVPGSNVIAQGGLTIEIDPTSISTNTLIFNTLPVSTINAYPRYSATLTVITSDSSDAIKSLRIKWPDVNKFSPPAGQNTAPFTFGFWCSANIEIPYEIYIHRYFGTTGSIVPDTFIDSGNILTSGVFIPINVNVPSNSGESVDLTDNNDFIAIDIRLPVNIAYNVSFTDITFCAGEDSITSFPLQTNADMLSRGVAGWLPTPAADGYDLYCPAVLTRLGMTFDHSNIGKIYADIGAIPATNSALAISNDMPMDGTSYLTSDWSYLGIPYARLGNLLLSKSAISYYPLFGTGPNYVTAWPDLNASNNAFFLIGNSGGASVPGAVDGSAMTGFAFSNIVSYNGVTTGFASIGWSANWGGSLLLTAYVAIAATNTNPVISGLGASTLTVQNLATGLWAQNLFGLSLSIDSGGSANFTVPVSGPYSGIMPFLDIFVNGVQYRIYLNVAGLSGSVSSGTNKFILSIPNDLTGAQVAQLISAVINCCQISYVIVGTQVPPNGSFFTFMCNSGSLRTIQPWYNSNPAATPPVALTGEEIQIVTPAGSPPSAADIIAATVTAIDGYQFYIPNLAGAFLRGNDPSMLFDLDFASRMSFGSGSASTGFGTMEFDQFQAHVHLATTVPSLTTNRSGSIFDSGSALDAYWDGSGTALTYATTIASAGGTETRPVNFSINWI